MNNSKLISIIVGVIALLLSVLGIVFVGLSKAGGVLALCGIIVGLASVIFSAMISKNNNGQNGVIGIILGLLAVVIGIIISISCLICSCTCGGLYGDNYYENKKNEDLVNDAVDALYDYDWDW